MRLTTPAVRAKVILLPTVAGVGAVVVLAATLCSGSRTQRDFDLLERGHYGAFEQSRAAKADFGHLQRVFQDAAARRGRRAARAPNGGAAEPDPTELSSQAAPLQELVGSFVVDGGPLRGHISAARRGGGRSPAPPGDALGDPHGGARAERGGNSADLVGVPRFVAAHR